METITLSIKCPDRKGLVFLLTNLIFQHNGNIVNLDQHTDNLCKMFFMRLEWDNRDFTIPHDQLNQTLKELFEKNSIQAVWNINFSNRQKKMAIFVSAHDHCLWDILIKHKAGEINCDIPLIISNHNQLRSIAEYFEINFEHIPLTKFNRDEAEDQTLTLLNKHKIDFLILARYMQILSAKMIDNYPDKIINIHHSFLPAFKGANPYRQAHERGVKIIGATAHFVTEELDQGPIITQNTIEISHKDEVNDLIVKGRNIEKTVFAEAVKLYIQNRIFVYKNRTIIL